MPPRRGSRPSTHPRQHRGPCGQQPPAQRTLADWDELVSLNARAIFLLVQGVQPCLPTPPPSSQERPRTEGGRLANIVSVSSHAAPSGMLDSIAKVWVKELPFSYGCKVNAISPGPTMIAGFPAAGNEFMKEMAQVVTQTPVDHRMPLPVKITFEVGFRCGPRASWINGLHLNASGGLHIV